MEIEPIHRSSECIAMNSNDFIMLILWTCRMHFSIFSLFFSNSNIILLCGHNFFTLKFWIEFWYFAIVDWYFYGRLTAGGGALAFIAWLVAMGTTSADFAFVICSGVIFGMAN
ncbi:hypothetical protein T4B_11110 [Trichinella pseudospiralis]|uniref:Uncharacterized protein n=1 Tax=Trichinella pseudospiralis TaxID=6337 RepID=A0A0V1INC5_TRIPS|nr:hypothetical protein T4B_11110 [Trichinella pseudospiralis]